MKEDKHQQSVNNSTQFEAKILHLSDLHVGMMNDQWLWPGFKNAFFDDLHRVFKKAGPWDIVVFSGDLTQKAQPREFERLTSILKEIWDLFSSLGFSPKFFPIPGNHDLVRPPKLDPATRLLSQWWEDAELRKAFWEADGETYLKTVKTSFQNYQNWVESLSNFIPMPVVSYGLLPGDISTIIKIGEKNVGLVGLNSAWLQLSDGNFEKKLHVDIRQLLKITDHDPDMWCQNNDFNILVTHHPIEWLNPESLSMWKSDINTRSRFDCHLFGHMHQPNSIIIAEAGGNSKQMIQGASLFGLEYYNDKIERIHGYSLLCLSHQPGTRSLIQWPRISRTLRDGTRKVVPDQEFDLDENDRISYTYGNQTKNTNKVFSNSPTSSSELVVTQVQDVLQALEYALPLSQAHLETRKVEQAISVSNLNDKRALWLVSDWGLGTDEFIACVQQNLKSHPQNVYRIDMQNYRNKNEILKGIKEQFGYSFQQVCEQISLASTSLLILDDVPINDHQNLRLQEEVENLTKIISQYCPKTSVIIKTRNVPSRSEIGVVALKPFDELDTNNYIKLHDLGRGIYSTHISAQIFRHTDGVPSRIDSILRDIPVVGTTELQSLNIHISGKSASSEEHPAGLVTLISEMESSKEPGIKKALDLLKVLTVFPRGEQYNSIKRFNNSSGFYTENVHTLIGSALIDSVEILSVGNDIEHDTARALVVRRPVREYLYTHMSLKELRVFNQKAMAMYFGDDWSIKGIRVAQRQRFEDARCGTWRIENACMMILRAAHEAIDTGNLQNQKNILNLAHAFCAALKEGDHFRNIVSLCDEFFLLYDSISPDELNLLPLRVRYATALRMTGEGKKSRDILLGLAEQHSSKLDKQSILQGLALCYETLGEKELARDYAEKCAAVIPNNNVALQARAIAVSAKENSPQRDAELRKIQEAARKKKAPIVVSQIELDFANRAKTAKEKIRIYEQISQEAGKAGDYLNFVKGTIYGLKIKINEGEELTTTEISRLISSYHYLYSESFDSLFDSCHATLWKAFESRGELNNLLKLFRYSSITWLVRNDLAKEIDYLKKVKFLFSEWSALNYAEADRETAYFLARASSNIESLSLSIEG